MALPGKINTKAITKHLHQLGAEVHTTDAQGNPITREQALAQVLWDLALGGEVVERDLEGNLKRVATKPVAWAIQYVMDRKEGKAVAATNDNETGIKAAEKVRGLAKDRLNDLALAAAAARKPALAGPPKYVPRAK
jgi:glucose dehydrogenase